MSADGMRIERVVVGAFESNCYVVAGRDGAAFAVDPGSDADRIAAALERAGARLEAVLLTHGHVDHVSGLGALLRGRPVPVYLHPADRDWAFAVANAIPPFYQPPSLVGAEFRDLADGQRFELAGFELDVLASPGHTPGGICFHFAGPGALFTGDTLFKGSVGRTDLRGGDGRALARSLERLAALPGETRVYPGHGPDTTIDYERCTNLFLRR